jgi:hypothetical protein
LNSRVGSSADKLVTEKLKAPNTTLVGAVSALSIKELPTNGIWFLSVGAGEEIEERITQ